MAIPNVSVNVNEVLNAGNSQNISFLPAILLKTKSGPIGTVERVNSETEFVTMFGQSDTTTPAAYALQKYLKLYNYAYVTRIANANSAAKGTLTLSFTDESTSESVDLIKVSSKYETDLYNGDVIKLVVDSDNEKIYIDLTGVMNRNITTIKEDISIGTVKAAEYDEDGNLVGGLEYILDKLVASANAVTKMPLVFENVFKNKIDTDTVPTSDQFTAGFEGYIADGNSGNDIAVSDNDVLDLIDQYHYKDYPIDEMVIPEYRHYAVVNYAVEKGRVNYYRVIAQATGHTLKEMEDSVLNYVQDDKGYLEIYANDVTYTDFVDDDGNLVECPVSIAVLNAYAYASYSKNEWCAIAGCSRGVLSQITGLAVKMTKAEMDELYDNNIPINTIDYISSVGYVVWGNKTSADETETELFDRVNVARLVNYMTRELTKVGWEYLFEPITLVLFSDFKARLEAICEIILNSDGIDDYVVICNSSNNTTETIAKNELHAEVQIQPTESLEYVIIDLTATDEITVDVRELSEEV